jgi:hypothetical protein
VDFSVSLNLVLISPANQRNQLFFNLEDGTVSGLAPNPSSSRTLICRLARHLGDGSSAELLDRLTVTHDSERMRWAAYDALASMDKSSFSRIWQRALSDEHPFVRTMARKALLDDHID